MHEHTPTLIIGDGGAANGVISIDHTDIREGCFDCWAEGDFADEMGPCAQYPPAQLTPGTLVQLPRTQEWANVPTRTAVVVNSAGPYAVIWCWALGIPQALKSSFIVLPADVQPLRTTLATLPRETYAALAAAHARYAPKVAGHLEPLAAPLAAAAH